MQKILKISVLFVFTAIITFAAFARIDTNVHGSDQTEKVSVSDDKKVRNTFLNNCARCHGADGKSDTELGEMYDATDLTVKYVKKMNRSKMSRVISNGKGDMPGFSKKLNSKEISLLVNYVRSLK